MRGEGGKEAKIMSLETIIDLRSDTVTKPSPGMRRAMAAAEVGDDVYGEDPTVARLEARGAELLEREAAVFVPSGTMGNQVAIHLHCRPGSEVVGEAGSHCFHFEMGAMAALSGALPRPVRGADPRPLRGHGLRGLDHAGGPLRGQPLQAMRPIRLLREGHAHSALSPGQRLSM